MIWAILSAATLAKAACTAGASDINQTPSYAKQCAYYWTIAMTPGAKPAPLAIDYFRMRDLHRGIVDLFGDRTLKMFFGARNETFNSASKNYRQTGLGL